MKTAARNVMALLITVGAMTAVAEQLTIKGSNTFGEKLGPRLVEAFKVQNPDWIVDLESRSSGYGIQALLDGQCDIAASSRALNEDESRIARSRRLTPTHHAIGFYGISVIVHPDNPIRNLADHQVRDIFSGAIANWSAIGGKPGPIVLHISTRSAGTYLGFQELALANRPYAASAVEHESYAKIAEAVAGDPAAIGYLAMSMVDRLPIRAVSINGVPANAISVADNLYPYARLLRLLTLKNRETPEAKAFIRYVRSSAGQQVVEEQGFVRRFMHRTSFGMETP